MVQHEQDFTTPPAAERDPEPGSARAPRRARERAQAAPIGRDRVADLGGAEASLMTPAEAAAFLRVSLKAFYALVERGAVPGIVRLGRRILVRRVDLRARVGL